MNYLFEAEEFDLDSYHRLRALADASRYLEANELLRTAPAPESWTDPPSTWEAARLLYHLGAPQRSKRLMLCSYRKDPADPVRRLGYLQEVAEHRGPYFAWRKLKEWPNPEAAPARFQALHWQMAAQLAASFRDFALLEAFSRRAESTGEETVRTRLLRVVRLLAEEQHDDALRVAEDILDDAPACTHANKAVVRLLIALHRREEALERLDSMPVDVSAARLTLMQAVIAMELQRYELAEGAVNRAMGQMPHMEPEVRGRLQCMLADCAYHQGNRKSFITLARSSEEPAYERLASRIEAHQGEPKHVQLDVPFVQQHHDTCVPATLTAIARYWGREVDHVAVADAICYDGTKSHRDRAWAMDNGWFAREFTLDWETSRALLDAGLPFAVVTVAGLQGHMQAVMGYDDPRRSLVFRDPSVGVALETDADLFFEQQAAYGPRALLIVPQQEAARVEAVELPEASLHDALSGIHAALERHARGDAQVELERLGKLAPDHRLYLYGQRALAAYDGDPEAILAICDKLVDRHREDWSSHAIALNAMAPIRSSSERTKRIEALLEREDLHPSMLEMVASVSSADAREHDRCSRLLRRLLRMAPLHAGAMNQLGRIAWARGDFDEGMELLRFASGLAETDDAKAWDTFISGVGLGHVEQAVELLRQRAERYRKRSAIPTMILFRGLEVLDRVEDAFDALDEALEVRPEDGELALFAARVHIRHGKMERADELLRRAGERCPHGDALRVQAERAEVRGDPRDALERWRKVVEHDPFGLEGHVAVARLLTTNEGPGAAREHLRAAVKSHPYRQDLARLHVDSLDGAEPQAAIDALHAHLDLVPNAAWAHRLLAEYQAKLGKLDDARSALDAARAIEPAVVEQRLSEAVVAARDRRFLEAKSCYREAISINPDLPGAILELMHVSGSAEDQRAQLDFVAGQLRERSIDGTGVMAWFAAERSLSTPAACAERVDQLRTSRPDLWATWSIAVRLACSRRKKKTGLALVREAMARFPTVWQLLLNAAELHQLRNKPALVEESLRKALAISRDASVALRLTQSLLGAGQHEEAGRVLELARSRHPTDAGLIVLDATLRWNAGDREEAITALETLLTRDPHATDAWGRLDHWAKAVNREQGALPLLQRSLESRPWDARLWLLSSAFEVARGRANRARDAAQRGAELDPLDVDILDHQAQALALLGDKEGALAICAKAGGFPDAAALPLRGREAWLLWTFGQRNEAIERMNNLIQSWPSYAWAHNQLTHWHLEQGNAQEAVRVAERFCANAPLDPDARVLLGRAQRAQGNQDDADQAFARALEVNPTHPGALGITILSLIQRRRLDEVPDLIDRLERTEPALAAHWRGRLAIARFDLDGLRAPLRTLVRENELELIHELALAASRERFSIAPRLRELMTSPDSPHQLGVLWAAVSVDMHETPTVADARKVMAVAPDAGHAAAAHVIESLALSGGRPAALWYALRLWPTSWTNATCWGAVGCALQSFLLQPFALLWFRGYRARDGLEPWMLLNVAATYRRVFATDREVEALEMALALPEDHSSARVRVLLAFHEACRGDVVRARQLLVLPPDKSQPLEEALRRVVEAVLIARGEGDVPRAKRFQTASERLGEALVLDSPRGTVLDFLRRARVDIARHTDKPVLRTVAVIRLFAFHAAMWILPWIVAAIVLWGIVWVIQ